LKNNGGGIPYEKSGGGGERRGRQDAGGVTCRRGAEDADEKTAAIAVIDDIWKKAKNRSAFFIRSGRGEKMPLWRVAGHCCVCYDDPRIRGSPACRRKDAY